MNLQYLKFWKKRYGVIDYVYFEQAYAMFPI